jgi:hypothetical protein
MYKIALYGIPCWVAWPRPRRVVVFIPINPNVSPASSYNSSCLDCCPVEWGGQDSFIHRFAAMKDHEVGRIPYPRHETEWSILLPSRPFCHRCHRFLYGNISKTGSWGPHGTYQQGAAVFRDSRLENSHP